MSIIPSANDNYEAMAQRMKHIPRLAGGIYSFAQFQVSRLKKGGAFQMETPGMAGHFLCFPRVRGARLQYRQENLLQEGFLEPGQITLLPAERGAKWVAETPPLVDTVNLYLAPQLLTDVANRTVTLTRPPWFWDNPLSALATLIADEVESGNPEGILYIETLVQAVAARLALYYAESASVPKTVLPGRAEVRTVIEIIHTSPAANHSLETLGSTVYLSASHLARLFRVETGKSVYAYLLETRLEKAHGLLAGRALSVSEVSIECGFCDSPHLARHFRRRYGYSPRDLRRR
ncbi:MAG: helix-turn-helix transcriptional regulator [Armatimonadetes bacterium]|nr:helix-turn-helix transcriptional regulator [Armatimonadota bacterium]